MSSMTIEAPAVECVVRVLLLAAEMRDSQQIKSALTDPCHGSFGVSWMQSLDESAESDILRFV